MFIIVGEPKLKCIIYLKYKQCTFLINFHWCPRAELLFVWDLWLWILRDSRVLKDIPYYYLWNLPWWWAREFLVLKNNKILWWQMKKLYLSKSNVMDHDSKILKDIIYELENVEQELSGSWNIIYDLQICALQEKLWSWKKVTMIYEDLELFLKHLWVLYEFLDLNVFPQSWQGKESPSRWVSMWFFRFLICLAVFPQSPHLYSPSELFSTCWLTVFSTSLTSSVETGTITLSTASISLGFWIWW